jgi:beta-galactosidase
LEIFDARMTRIILITILLTVLYPDLRAQRGNQFFPENQLVTIGIYYYPEQWSEDQWERDIRKISEMGFEFVHLAEFAWFKMEPEEGKYDFNWLDKVVNLCVKYNLKVLLCTPSATPPAWMRINYPETYILYNHYIRGENGTRGLGSIVNKKYRMFVENVVTGLAKRYGQNKNVVGWQLDNEPQALADYSPASQEAFRLWLQKKYNSVDALNAAWGNAFWSQWFKSFDQVIIPNANLVGWWGSNPHALLDFKRYSADAQAEFLDLQASTLRKHITQSQYITTNYTAICTGSDPNRTKLLDFATYTAYPNHGTENIGDIGFRLGDSRVVLFASEYFKDLGGATGVMEMQPGPVNWGSSNPLLMPGTVRMWLYHSVASGGKLASSYRFRQVNYSAEQYHSAIMLADGVTPSPGADDYMQFMKEIKDLRKQFVPGANPPPTLTARSTAILWNLENYWSIDRQKQTTQWDTWNYPVKFLEIAKSFGAPTAVISANSNFSDYKFMVVPAYEMVDSALVKKLRDYASNGGHLIITCRTATKDRRGHFWEGPPAAPITELIGANIKFTDMLPQSRKGKVLMMGSQYDWNNWGELIEPHKNTTALATFDNVFYKGTVAVTKKNLGSGTVTYIGVDTDNGALEKNVLRQVYSDGGVATEDYPPGVLVYWRDGFNFAVNYSSTEYNMNLPATAKILVGEKTLKPAGVLVWK